MHRETANTLNAISREQKILFDHYMKLRKVLNENEKVRNMQLVKLCTDSETALRNLRDCLELAERIGIMFLKLLSCFAYLKVHFLGVGKNFRLLMQSCCFFLFFFLPTFQISQKLSIRFSRNFAQSFYTQRGPCVCKGIKIVWLGCEKHSQN